jgi:hypothetical protein
MNRLKRALATLIIGCLLCSTAYAEECVQPPVPSKIPDGKTASKLEMDMAQSTFKEYNADMETYLKCLDFEAKQGHMTTKKYNDAVDVLKAVAKKFNTQIDAFNKKSG